MRTSQFSPVFRPKLACAALLAGALLAGPAAADSPGKQQATALIKPQLDRTTEAVRRELSLAELRARLGAEDHGVALKALHLALNRISDGATFVWRKRSRSLVGVIRPTSAFRNAIGQICRHVVYTLSLGRYLKRIEGVACREINGSWTLSG